MWIIILIAAGAPTLTPQVAGFRFPTLGECLVSAQNRAEALHSIDIHGYYECVQEGKRTWNAPRYRF